MNDPCPPIQKAYCLANHRKKIWYQTSRGSMLGYRYDRLWFWILWNRPHQSGKCNLIILSSIYAEEFVVDLRSEEYYFKEECWEYFEWSFKYCWWGFGCDTGFHPEQVRFRLILPQA